MTDIERQLERARRALEANRFDELKAACGEVQKLNPAEAEPYYLMGMAAYRQHAHAQADQLFARAAELDPTSPRPLAMRAATQILMGLSSAALLNVDAAEPLEPKDAMTLDTLGVALSRTGGYAKAADYFRRAVALEPGNATYLMNLGYGEQFLGDLDAAEVAFRRAIAADPDLAQAYLSVVEMRKQTADNNFVAALADLYQTSWQSTERRLLIGHALAKTYEDLGQWEESLIWLDRAKDGRRAEVGFSIDAARDTFAAAAETFHTGDRLTGGFSSDEPIFVVGLPRTGTTLVDRILGSHPDVTSVEELSNFPSLVKRNGKTSTPYLVDAASLRAARKLNFTLLGADYVKSTRPLTGATPRFVDKLPFNFLYAGLIHRALPEARIVCLRRDGMDTVLNNYRQMFAAQSHYHGYTTRLEDVARYFVAFERLIAHWRAVLPPDRFTEVSYENLVANQEFETRRLIDFCGLPWDDRCLAFHENTAGVSTASAAQVRSPIYATSVGRWKRYGGALKPAADILREAGLLTE